MEKMVLGGEKAGEKRRVKVFPLPLMSDFVIVIGG